MFKLKQISIVESIQGFLLIGGACWTVLKSFGGFTETYNASSLFDHTVGRMLKQRG